MNFYDSLKDNDNNYVISYIIKESIEIIKK